MKAAIYVRVSTEEQVEEGYSISAQRDRLKAFCVSQNWEIHDFYVDEGKSAKDLNRPDLNRLLNDMEEGLFEIVLVYRLDRLTRSVVDLYKLLQQFDNHSIKFKSATEVYDTTTAMGRLFITLVAALAQWERENLGERVRFGMEQMAREGNRPGAPKPFGYDSEGNMVEEEAAILRELRDLYMKGHGFFTISQTLNRQGKLHRGAIWTQQYVKYCLENPYYAGMIRWGRDGRGEEIVSEGTHEPIWSQEAFDIHNRRMRMRSGKNYTKTYQYWFTGVLRCGRCGEAMTGRMHRAKRVRTKDYVFLSYRCTGRNSGTGCGLPNIRQELVEQLIFRYIENYKVSMNRVQEKSKQLKTEERKREHERQALQKELVKIRDRIQKWQRMCVNELITESELRNYLREERQQESDVASRLSQYTNEESNVPKEMLTLTDAWDEMDDQERHSVIVTIFKKIVIQAPDEPVPSMGKYRNAFIESLEYN